jgi:O-antigen/teichoic acid export membrane protein
MPQTRDASNPNHNFSQGGMDIAKQSVRSSVVLSAGSLIETVVSVAASLIIARLLGPGGYGAFSLVLTLSILFSIFVDFGAIYAIQHNAAYFVSRGDTTTARRMTRNAILFTLITGSILSAISFLAASQLSVYILHRTSLTFFVQITSPLILAQALFTAITLAFLGWGSPGYTSGLNILQPVLKLLLAPLLIILGFGVLGALVGHVVSYVITAIIGVGAIYFLKLRSQTLKTPKLTSMPDSSGSKASLASEKSGPSADSRLHSNAQRSSFSYFVSDVKEITRYGVPAYIGNGIYQFATASFVLFLLSAFVPNAAIGYYSAAYNAAQAVAVISSAIGLSLFSAFSSLGGINADVRSPLRYSVTYVSLVLLPLALFAIGASNAIMVTFYGASYAPATPIFSFLVLSYMPGALGLTIFPSFFNGIGKTKLTLVIQLASSLVILSLAPALELEGWGIPGVLYSLIAASVFSAIVGTYLVRHYLNTSIDFGAAARIFLTSDICFLTIYVLQMFTHFSHVLTLSTDFIVYFGIYLTLLPIMRAVTLGDFERLKEATGSLGAIKKIMDLLLGYEIYLMKKTGSKSA